MTLPFSIPFNLAAGANLPGTQPFLAAPIASQLAFSPSTALPRTLTGPTGVTSFVVRNLTPFLSSIIPGFNTSQLAADPNWSAAAPPLLTSLGQQNTPGYLMDTLTGNSQDPASGTAGSVLFFQYNPEEVTVERDTNYLITPMPGRSNPFVQWIGNGPHKITFELKFWFSRADNSGSGISSYGTGIGNVQDCINWIQSYQLPQPQTLNQNGSAVTIGSAPRMLTLYLGETFATDASQVVNVLLLRSTTRYSKLWHPSSLAPRFASIQLEFLGMLQPNVSNEYWTDHRSTFGAKEQRSPLNPRNPITPGNIAKAGQAITQLIPNMPSIPL